MKKKTKDKITIAVIFVLPIFFILILRMLIPASPGDLAISKYVFTQISNQTGWFEKENHSQNEHVGKRMYIGGATIALYEIVQPDDIKQIEIIAQKAIEEIGGTVSLFFYEKQNIVRGFRKKEKLLKKSVFNSNK